MGGGSSGTSKQQAMPVVPPEASALIGAVTPGITEAWNSMPFSNFFAPSPFSAPSDQTMQIINNIVSGAGGLGTNLLNLFGGHDTTANLTPGQASAMTGIQGLLDPSSMDRTAMASAINKATQQVNAPLTSPTEDASINYLKSVIGAPIGSSPATLEAIKNWQNTAQPLIQNTARMGGLGTSGAVPAAIGQGMSSLLAPLYATEIADRSGATNALLTEGNILEGRPGARASNLANLAGGDMGLVANLLAGQANLGGAQLTNPITAFMNMMQGGTTALGASQIPQQQAQSDYLRQQALMEEIANVVTGNLLPSTFGQTGGGTTSTRGSGLLGALFGGGAK